VLKVSLTGRVAVESDGATIDERRFPGRQGRLLFAYLVAEHGRPVPREELADALWGDSPPATWEKALSVLASKVRTVLADGGLDGSRILTAAFGCYRLELPEGSSVDVVAAAAALREAEAALAAGDLERAKSEAASASSLLRQPFLPGEERPWIEGRRRELDDVRSRALGVLAEACLRSGEAIEAAKWAEQAVALEPFRETGYRVLMDAHAAAGNRAEALRVYERCRRLLAEELGAYPSPETESVYRDLLAAPASRSAEVSADPPAAAVPGPARAATRRRPSRRIGAGALVLVAIGALIAVLLTARSGNAPAAGVAADAVGLIDAGSDAVRGQALVDGAPTGIAYGDGSVWVTSASGDHVTRVDPTSRIVRQTIPVGASPTGVAVGGGGVWVANHDDGTVSWINPQSDSVVRTIPVGAGPTAVAYGFGSIWVANTDDRTLTRIDARTGRVEATVRTNAAARGVATGGGSVWVTDEATRSVFAIDPATNTVTSTATVGTGPAGIAYGDGSVWVANSLDDTVSQVDATTLTARATISVPGGPSTVGFGDGAVWVGAEFGGRVVRIDPRRGVVVRSIAIDNRPEGLAASGAGVWVAVQTSGEGHRGGRLVVAGSGLDTIDPNLYDSTDAFAVLSMVYDGLTGFRRAGGAAGTQIVPDLAAALPLATAGGTSYAFRIRAGIRYSDGRLLRAADFRRALVRELALRGPSATSFSKVVGAARCMGNRRCDLSRGMVVDGPLRLTIRLTAPDPRLFYSLTALAPVPPGTPLHDVGTRPVSSTGPYEIQSYVPGGLLTLVRNRYFRVWSTAARPDGYPDEIAYRTIVGNGPNTAVRDVLAGKDDLLFEADLTGARTRELAARYPQQLHLDPQQATTFLFLNVRRHPFDDVRVRRALNYAVDRRRIAALHGSPLAKPTCQIVPPHVPGYRPYCPYTVQPDANGDWKAPDLAKARALIRASGTRGETVVVWSTGYFGRESRYLVSLLKQLGYRAQLHYIPDINAYFAALGPDVQAGFAGWFGAPLAVDMFSGLECSGQGQSNWAQFCDHRIDAQVERLRTEEPADPAGTAALAATIDRELTDAAPWVPLFTPRLPDLTSPRVGNYEDNQGTVLIDQLWVR
jgi:peptide/nickel transport system substrate-binding protein